MTCDKCGRPMEGPFYYTCFCGRELYDILIEHRAGRVRTETKFPTPSYPKANNGQPPTNTDVI